jgi:hypothetical protein
MRQLQPTQQPTAAVCAVAEQTETRDRMRRGLVHGIILSLAVWAAAGYLTFILR